MKKPGTLTALGDGAGRAGLRTVRPIKVSEWDMRVVGCAEHAPLAKLPNVVLTPHIGASTVDTQREIGEQRN